MKDKLVRKLILKREKLSEVRGGEWHRTSVRCHEGWTNTGCYACPPYTATNCYECSIQGC